MTLPATEQQTYWNGEPCEARRVRVIVADAAEFPAYWARQFVGQERAAVEVTYNGKTFYLDDEGHVPSEVEREVLAGFGRPLEDRVGHPGYGWEKVTEGRGSPRRAHSSLRIERVV